jgi:WXXGXW repeat (2 copies)
MKRSVRWVVFGILMLTVSVLSLSTASSAQIGIGISVRVGPPALPVYAQPLCPGPGYFWTPGYWAWSDDDGYYWVPGTWVVAPVGMLWTPGYWAFSGGFYGWHAGYWGRHVGFYGGINYGFGYGGVGFFGGEWRGGSFFYNRSVTNVNVTNVTNVYNRTVIVNNTRNVSFNGRGGVEARPTPQEERFSREPHNAALAAQTQHEHAAGQNRQLFASQNHGRPAIAATAKSGEFNGPRVQPARAAGQPYRAPKITPQEARGQAPGNRGGNRGFETPARNGGNGNNRATSRPGNPEVRNNQPRNREQMSPRDNPRPNRQEKPAQNQQRAAQERAANPNRAPARAEQRRNPPEQHH